MLIVLVFSVILLWLYIVGGLIISLRILYGELSVSNKSDISVQSIGPFALSLWVNVNLAKDKG